MLLVWNLQQCISASSHTCMVDRVHCPTIILCTLEFNCGRVSSNSVRFVSGYYVLHSVQVVSQLATVKWQWIASSARSRLEMFTEVLVLLISLCTYSASVIFPELHHKLPEYWAHPDCNVKSSWCLRHFWVLSPETFFTLLHWLNNVRLVFWCTNSAS